MNTKTIRHISIDLNRYTNIFNMSIKRQMHFKSLYDLLICTYRITNKANTIPIITGTQAPTVPPTIAGKLADKDKGIVVVSRKNEITKYST